MLRRHHPIQRGATRDPELPISRYQTKKRPIRSYSWRRWTILAAFALIGIVTIYLWSNSSPEYEKFTVREIREFPQITPLAKLSSFPMVTVISTLVKADQFIDHFLDNILNQTWPKASTDVLLLNVDGLVSDLVISRCRSAQSRNPHLRLIDIPRVGLYEGWNLAIEKYARGEYITISNPDDSRHPNSIEKQVSFLMKHSSYDIACNPVVASRVPNLNLDEALSDPNSEVWWRTRNGFSITSVAQLFLWDDWGMLQSSMNFPHAHPMWRKNAIHQSLGYFRVEEDPLSDFALWARAIAQGHLAFMLPDPLSVYLVNNASYGRSGNTDKLVENIFTQVEKSLSCRELNVWIVTDHLPSNLLLSASKLLSSLQFRMWQVLEKTLSSGHHVTLVTRDSSNVNENDSWWRQLENTPRVYAKSLSDHNLESLHEILKLSSGSSVPLGSPDVIVTHLNWDMSLAHSTGELVISVMEDVIGSNEDDMKRWPILVAVADDVFAERIAWERMSTNRSVDSWAQKNIDTRQRKALLRSDLVLSGNPDAIRSKFPFARAFEFTFSAKSELESDHFDFAKRRGLVFWAASYTAAKCASLEWFLTAVHPTLRKLFPDLFVTIVGDSNWSKYQQRSTMILYEPHSKLQKVLASARVLFDSEGNNVTHEGNLNSDYGFNADLAMLLGEYVSVVPPVIGSSSSLRGICCESSRNKKAQNESNACAKWKSVSVSYPTATDFVRKLSRVYANESLWTEAVKTQRDLVLDCFRSPPSSKNVYSSLLRTLSRTLCNSHRTNTRRKSSDPEAEEENDVPLDPPANFRWKSVTKWETRDYKRTE